MTESIIDNQWVRVLKHFDLKGYYHNGLTLPFLCGVRTILNPTFQPMTISEFIINTVISLEKTELTLLKCNYIEEYVVGVLDHESRMIYKKHSLRYPQIFKPIGRFYITDGSMNNIENTEALIRFFEEVYDEKIQTGCYSKNAGVWGDYSELERERICEAIL